MCCWTHRHKLQLKLKFIPDDTTNESSHCILWAYLTMWGNRGKQMQLTAGLIGLKTSFFSSGFLGALSWRCDGEPSDLDDAAYAKTPKGKQNKTGIHQEGKIHFLIPLWSEEQRWEGYQSSAWEQDTSFTGSLLHFPWKTTQKNIAKLWSLQVQLTSDWGQTKLSHNCKSMWLQILSHLHKGLGPQVIETA